VLGPGQLQIEPGRYVANVVVPFPASLLASADMLKSGIEKKGFSNVVVTTTPPPGWPLPTKADYFVSVDWTGPAQVFDVPSAVTADKRIA